MKRRKLSDLVSKMLEDHPQASEIAREFYEVYEMLAPLVGYRTRTRSAVPWSEVPSDNKRLMEATVATLLQRGVIR